MKHSGNFRDVPLIEVSVKDGSPIKHCRKKRRPITLTVNVLEKKAEEPWSQYCNSPNKANILQYMSWLTGFHSVNFRDVPLIEVSVKNWSPFKHCRKKRRPLIFSQRARKVGGRALITILQQPKEGEHSSNYIHHTTNQSMKSHQEIS